jgi:hypothetical protein
MRMLLAASACALAMTGPAPAASVTVADNSAALPDVAVSTTALLIDAGLAVHNAGGGKFVVEAKNYHCDQRNNGALDASDFHAGLLSEKCRINSKNEKGTTKGKPFGDHRALTDLLLKIQNSSANGGTGFSDCAMGYCGVFAKSITCTIDTNVQNLVGGGRWSCIYVDGQ